MMMMVMRHLLDNEEKYVLKGSFIRWTYLMLWGSYLIIDIILSHICPQSVTIQMFIVLNYMLKFLLPHQ